MSLKSKTLGPPGIDYLEHRAQLLWQDSTPLIGWFCSQAVRRIQSLSTCETPRVRDGVLWLPVGWAFEIRAEKHLPASQRVLIVLLFEPGGRAHVGYPRTCFAEAIQFNHNHFDRFEQPS